MADVSVLEVLLHDEPIGTLTHVGGERAIFAFNEDHINDENRSVLGLGFKDPYGELITSFRPYKMKLMPFFSNLLPEGRMRTYLAERAGVHPDREFFLTWALGMDLSGAITIKSADGESWPPTADDDHHLDHGHGEGPLRFSLAGVQLKFSALEEHKRGLTIPAEGIGGSWIVKLPSTTYAGVPENEYSMMTLARLIGMDVPAIRLIDLHDIKNLPSGLDILKGQQAYAIKRFDRLPTDGTAVHAEDFAQIFGVYPDDKYGKASMRSLARVIAAESSEVDIAEFIQRLTFNMLIGNADMHLKNWSIIYPDRHHAALAPAYDFVSTIAYIHDDKAALSVSRSKEFAAFSEDELSHLAAKAMLPEKLVLNTARETIALFHERWQAEKENLPLHTNVINAIEEHLKTIPVA
ncbi:MAG: Serine/threonine-protein kinase toxin HipA [Gammaproteobacteria bacterium]|nr:Serine/threonine-protein kinase toxin HipA [Gammaproteobacteria bacterium]